MIAPTYTGKGGYVWKEPVETRHPDGSSSVTLGFRVCKVMPEVGDEAAGTLAAMLNAAERAEAEAAIKADLLAALQSCLSEYDGWSNDQLRRFTTAVTLERIEASRAAIAKATGQDDAA